MTNVDNDMDVFTQALSSVIDRNCDRDIAGGIVAIHGFALARAAAAEAEAARLRNELAAMTDDRDQWQAAYADNELYGLAVMQRRDELEAEAPRLRDEVRSLTPRPSYEAMAARVAELEVELAAQSAQGWRDFTEHPPIGELIQIVTVIDAVREEPDGLYRIGNTSEWQAWRPAPQEPTQ